MFFQNVKNWGKIKSRQNWRLTPTSALHIEEEKLFHKYLVFPLTRYVMSIQTLTIFFSFLLFYFIFSNFTFLFLYFIGKTMKKARDKEVT